MIWLNQDKDFMEYPYRVYLNLKTGEIVGVYEDDEEAANLYGEEVGRQNREQKLTVRKRRKLFLEFPIPDHGQRHKWFREFLKSQGQEHTYFGSIGGWLKECGTEEDHHAWRNLETDRVIQHAIDVAKAAGIKLKIT